MSQKQLPTSQAEGHTFNVQYAAIYGVPEAVLIAHFQKWINHNIAMKKNFHDGYTWSYQTRAEIAAWFPYFTEKQVRTLIDKLVKYGVLIKGNYNKSNFDKTVWYAFKDEEMFTTAHMGQSTAKKGHTIPCTKPCTKKEPTNPIDSANEVDTSCALAIGDLSGGFFLKSFSFDDKEISKIKRVMKKHDRSGEEVEQYCEYMSKSKPDEPIGWLLKALKEGYKLAKLKKGNKYQEMVENAVAGNSVSFTYFEDRVNFYKEGYAGKELLFSDKEFDQKMKKIIEIYNELD